MTLLLKLYLCHHKYFDICCGQASDSTEWFCYYIFNPLRLFSSQFSCFHIANIKSLPAVKSGDPFLALKCLSGTEKSFILNTKKIKDLHNMLKVVTMRAANLKATLWSRTRDNKCLPWQTFTAHELAQLSPPYPSWGCSQWQQGWQLCPEAWQQHLPLLCLHWWGRCAGHWGDPDHSAPPAAASATQRTCCWCLLYSTDTSCLHLQTQVHFTWQYML